MESCFENSCNSQVVVFQVNKQNILACDGMWKALICLAILDTDWSVLGLALWIAKSQSVLQTRLCFIGEQILQFLFQN